MPALTRGEVGPTAVAIITVRMFELARVINVEANSASLKVAASILSGTHCLASCLPVDLLALTVAVWNTTALAPASRWLRTAYAPINPGRLRQATARLKTDCELLTLSCSFQ